MNKKRDDFLAKVKEMSESRLIRERYKKFVGKSIILQKLSESNFRKNENDLSKYIFWFKSNEKPGEGCAIMEADVCVEIYTEDNIIEKIRVLVNTMDKFGTGRTFEPEFLHPDDAEFVSCIIEPILDMAR